MVVNGKTVQSISYDGKDMNIYKDLQDVLEGNIYELTPTTHTGLTTIKPYGLAYTVLRKVELPSTVTSIKGYAFTSCGALIEVIIPETFESDPQNDKGFIDLNATYAGHFYGATKIAAFYLQRNQLYPNKNRFLSTLASDPSLHIFVHPDQYSSYINDASWTDYVSKIYTLPTYSYDLTQLQWEQGYYNNKNGTAITHAGYTRTPKISIDDINLTLEKQYCAYGNIKHSSANPSYLYVWYWNGSNTYLGYQNSANERPMIELNIPSATKYIAFGFLRANHKPEDVMVAKLVSLERPS